MGSGSKETGCIAIRPDVSEGLRETESREVDCEGSTDLPGLQGKPVAGHVEQLEAGTGLALGKQDAWDVKAHEN